MSDISQVQLGSRLYNVKDNTARQRMIDNTTDSDVNAIVNFINGLKINGNSVISQATADVVAIPADDEPGVDLTVDQQGKAHFSFRIPNAKIAYISAYFSGKQLIFSNDDDYFAEYVGNEIYLGEVVDTN